MATRADIIAAAHDPQFLLLQGFIESYTRSIARMQSISAALLEDAASRYFSSAIKFAELGLVPNSQQMLAELETQRSESLSNFERMRNGLPLEDEPNESEELVTKLVSDWDESEFDSLEPHLIQAIRAASEVEHQTGDENVADESSQVIDAFFAIYNTNEIKTLVDGIPNVRSLPPMQRIAKVERVLKGSFLRKVAREAAIQIVVEMILTSAGLVIASDTWTKTIIPMLTTVVTALYNAYDKVSKE